MEKQKKLFELKPSRLIKISQYILYFLLLGTIIKIAISPYNFFNSGASYLWFVNLFCFYALYAQIKCTGFSVLENGFIQASDSNSRLSAIPLSEIASIKLYKNYYFEAIEKKISAYVLLDKANRIVNYLSTTLYSKNDAYQFIAFLKTKNPHLNIDIDHSVNNTITKKTILVLKGRYKIYKFIGMMNMLGMLSFLAILLWNDFQNISQKSVNNIVQFYLEENPTKFQLYILLLFVFMMCHLIYSMFKGGAFGKIYEDGLISMRTSGASISFFYLWQIKKVSKVIGKAANMQTNMRTSIAYYSFIDKDRNVMATVGAMLLSKADQINLFQLLQEKGVQFENF